MDSPSSKIYRLWFEFQFENDKIKWLDVLRTSKHPLIKNKIQITVVLYLVITLLFGQQIKTSELVSIIVYHLISLFTFVNVNSYPNIHEWFIFKIWTATRMYWILDSCYWIENFCYCIYKNTITIRSFYSMKYWYIFYI